MGKDSAAGRQPKVAPPPTRRRFVTKTTPDGSPGSSSTTATSGAACRTPSIQGRLSIKSPVQETVDAAMDKNRRNEQRVEKTKEGKRKGEKKEKDKSVKKHKEDQTEKREKEKEMEKEKERVKEERRKAKKAREEEKEKEAKAEAKEMVKKREKEKEKEKEKVAKQKVKGQVKGKETEKVEDKEKGKEKKRKHEHKDSPDESCRKKQKGNETGKKNKKSEKDKKRKDKVDVEEEKEEKEEKEEEKEEENEEPGDAMIEEGDDAGLDNLTPSELDSLIDALCVPETGAPSDVEEEEEEEEESEHEGEGENDGEGEDGSDDGDEEDSSSESSSAVEMHAESEELEEGDGEDDLDGEMLTDPEGEDKAEEINDASKKSEEMSVRNSKTMPKEWATFTRECQNRKKFPVALSDHLQRDKLDLFQAWLDNSKNLNEVALAMERKVENVNRVRVGRRGKKKRELLQCYPAEKVDKLCAALQAKNMYYWDPDFPNDEEEIYFYANDGATVTHDNLTSSAMTMKAKATPDAQTLADLTQDGAPLASGVLPDIQSVGGEGVKAVWQGVSGGQVVKSKLPKKRDDQEAVEVKPKSAEEKAADTMKSALSEAGESRKLAISLKAVEYGGELTTRLLETSKALEKSFEDYTDLKHRACNDPKLIQKAVDKVEPHLKWLEKAKAAAKSLLAGLNKKAKGKAKAKAKTKAVASQ